ncbi:MAG: exopolyphosphatase [Rhodospirillales bacterium]|nr:exopolyphosphatase [Alphaproteobacteria bacterium]MBL6948135.1 exopolyphosphatase [Rhodospirillales bacterium]
MSDKKFRLITRADFDGVVCGALFNELGMIDDIAFAEPNDMQQGRVPVSDKDITANLPYVEGAHLCFDHHRSEVERVGDRENLIIDADAPSAARVVYRHFGGKDGFPQISDELLEAVDQADAAQYTADDILAPENWTLLNFIVDPRTGMERVEGFNIAHNGFLYDLMTYVRHTPINEILQLPDVQERVNAYMYQREFAELQLIRCSEIHDRLVVVDLRKEDPIYVCGRFLIYALNPNCNMSMHLLPGPGEGMTSIALGKSILDRSSKTDIGALLLEYGGGGHEAAGGCRVENDKAETLVGELIRRINADG